MAVTWGIFPNKEIVQPTIFDVDAFMAWKDEAFEVFVRQWGQIYEEGSPAKEILKEIHDDFYLVNVIDNDFVGGDITELFREILTRIS